jgi:hypothetical protein
MRKGNPHAERELHRLIGSDPLYLKSLRKKRNKVDWGKKTQEASKMWKKHMYNKPKP